MVSVLLIMKFSIRENFIAFESNLWVCMMIAEHIVVNLKSKKLLIGNYFQKQKL